MFNIFSNNKNKSLYKVVTKTRVMKSTWGSEQYKKQKLKLDQIALNCWKCDLNREFGAILNLKIQYLPEREFDQSYLNSDQIDRNIETSANFTFDIKEYIGPEEGAVIVHRRIIPKNLSDKNGDILAREQKNGEMFVRTFLPQAIHRVGCYCCYGYGPNLSINYKEKGDNIIMEFEVDFFFDAGDYE